MEMDKIKEYVESIVKGTLSEADVSSLASDIEKVFVSAREQIEKLTAALEEKKTVLEEADTKMASTEKQLADSAAQLSVATASLEESLASLSAKTEEALSLETELSAVKESLSLSQIEVVSLQKRIALSGRLSVLENAGLIVEGEGAEDQKTRVEGMTEDDFNAYVKEMTVIKASVNPSSSATHLGALDIETPPTESLSEKYMKLGEALAKSLRNSKK